MPLTEDEKELELHNRIIADHEAITKFSKHFPSWIGPSSPYSDNIQYHYQKRRELQIMIEDANKKQRNKKNVAKPR